MRFDVGLHAGLGFYGNFDEQALWGRQQTMRNCWIAMAPDTTIGFSDVRTAGIVHSGFGVDRSCVPEVTPRRNGLTRDQTGRFRRRHHGPSDITTDDNKHSDAANDDGGCSTENALLASYEGKDGQSARQDRSW